MNNLADELAKLAELHRSGALSAEEFAAAKQRLLEGAGAPISTRSSSAGATAGSDGTPGNSTPMKGFGVKALLALATLLAVGVAGYFVFRPFESPKSENTVVGQPEIRISSGAVSTSAPIIIADLKLKLISIAPGTFTMGSTSSEASSNEKPLTQVTLRKPYWLGETEVTQGQWEAVMGNNPSKFKGANLPVEQVSYDDALAFCAKLTERERAAGRLSSSYAYTLPTEAQWEYACRAGTTGDYPGDFDAMTWYKENSGEMTHPVGTKQANAWGLYDMYGNVSEWVLDWNADYPGGSVTDYSGPSVPGSDRVIRGGSWRYPAFNCRSSVRDRSTPDFRDVNLGFRLALSPTR